MSAKGKGKKRYVPNNEAIIDEVDLFAKLNTKSDSDDQSSDDTTDSDESVYSGLDEEESSEAESFEEMPDSMSEGTSDSDEEGEDDEDEEAEDEDGDSSDNNDSEDSSVDEEYNVEEVHKDVVKHNKRNDAATSKSKTELKKKSKKKGSASLPETTQIDSSVKSPAEPTTSKKVATVRGPDEYDFDSSDEEDLRNTVGNIPMKWYREYEHIGYNLLGQKIIKPSSGDQLDEFLNKMDNPDYWRTVVDKMTGQNVVLSDKDVEMIKQMKKGKYVNPSFDPYQPWVDFFSNEVMQHPVTNRPAHKRSFIPSKWERIKVGRMVHAIKMGWMKPKPEKKKDDTDSPDYYMLWESDETSDITKRFRAHIPAPKMALPGHAESYNPPPEYLLTEEEELAWKEQDPEDRRSNFIPQKYSSLRRVPGYDRFINERFERCLDLYLCPRQRKMRMNVDPEDLLPKLPKPKDLQPFPTVQALLYKGHTSLVRCISVEPSGQWLVSGSDDQTIRFWEVCTGRCMKTLTVPGVVKGVVWNPNPALCLVAAVVEETIFVINPLLGDKLVLSHTDNMLESSQQGESDSDTSAAEWQNCEREDYDEGFRLKITHSKALGQLTWHARGDYLAVVIPGDESKSVVIHQLSRRRSQYPFKKSKGLVQCVMFHPTRPFLFVATQRYVRVYNLLKQELTKKLMTNVKWVSSMSVHPGGDNVIVGSYDSRLIWFDLDLSSKPYQTLRHHKKAIRQVCYHKKYPLFASASDDGSVIICHGRVYDDLLQNPLIVPVKVLRGHEVKNNLGVLDCQFHPTQPWIFSSGRDNTIRLYT